MSSDPPSPQEDPKLTKDTPKEEKAPDDAEVSIREKPAPSVKPTVLPTKVATPKPTAKPTAKATPKPTPKPPTQADVNKDYQKAMQRYLGESTAAGGKNFGAAIPGVKGMGGGSQISAEEKAYYLALQSHVKRGWRWYDTTVPYLAKATFRISPTGELTDVHLVQGSGVREFDDSVLRALAKANPVPRPPEKVYSKFSFVEMTFNPRE